MRDFRISRRFPTCNPSLQFGQSTHTETTVESNGHLTSLTAEPHVAAVNSAASNHEDRSNGPSGAVKFTVRKSFQLAPILVAMIWINWSVDPVMLYDHHFEDLRRHPYVGMITRDLLSGKPHAAAAYYSERLVQEVMFRHQPAIEVLVLGSSMAKPIHHELFPGRSFYNASCFGGRLEEMVSLWEMARGDGIHPKRVLLQLDAGYIGERRSPVSAEWSGIFNQARHRLCGDENPVGRGTILSFDPRVPGEEAAGFASGSGLFYPYDTLISPRYLQLSVFFLWKKWSAGNSYPVMFGEDQQHLIYPDGSVQWCAFWRRRKITDFHSPTQNPQTPIVAADWMRPIEYQRRLFEALIADIQKSGARVDFVLLPSNPWLYDQAVTEFGRAGKSLPSTDTETYLRRYAKQNRIQVIGSLDPHQAGVVEEDFVDFVHMRRESVDALFARSRTTEGDR